MHDVALLGDIIELATLIRAQADRLGREAFLQDRDALDATSYRLIAIGEAARGLSDAIKSLRPDVPWAQIVAMRNLLAHQYFMRESTIVWETVTVGLVDLVAACETEIERLA